MILDKLLQFSSAQALTSTGTAASTNVIDLGVARNVGPSPGIRARASVNTTFTSGGAGTLQAVLQGSADNSTFYTLAAGEVFALAALVAGAVLLDVEVPSNMGANAPPRYLRMAYVIATAAMTGGAVDAQLSLDTENRYDYAPGVAINT